MLCSKCGFYSHFTRDCTRVTERTLAANSNGSDQPRDMIVQKETPSVQAKGKASMAKQPPSGGNPSLTKA